MKIENKLTRSCAEGNFQLVSGPIIVADSLRLSLWDLQSIEGGDLGSTHVVRKAIPDRGSMCYSRVEVIQCGIDVPIERSK